MMRSSVGRKLIEMVTGRQELRMLASLLALGALPVPTANANFVFFDAITDSIQINGQTNLTSTSTYEALVRPSPGSSGEIIYNEWTFAQEDKQFSVLSGSVRGYNFPGATLLIGSTSVTPNVWHHVAFVDDGSDERVYLDGNLLASQTGNASIGNGNGIAHIGAIDRGIIYNSFLGYMDSFRISDIARYSGSSFSAPSGNLSNDGNTVLLYNFQDNPLGTTVADSSASGFDGQLGVGFSGVTSPEFVSVVPEPAQYGAILALFAGLISLRHSRSQLTTRAF